MRINPYSTSNIPAYGVGQNSKKTPTLIERTDTQEQKTTDAAVKVEISENARIISKGLKTYGENSTLKLDGAFFSQEAKAQRKADSGKALSQPIEVDLFENEFQTLGVQYSFDEGTLEKFILDGLEGKMTNASLVAAELGQMIRGTISNPDATVEERALNRETALKHAEYIAQKYFDNPDDANAFLEGINRFAENDVLREKGYVVLDNSNETPFKSYTMPTAPSDYVRVNYETARDIMGSNKPQTEKEDALAKLRDDIVKRFEENEKYVTDILDKAKNTLNETDVAKSLQRLMKAF